MNAATYLFALVATLVLGGCNSAGQSQESPKAAALPDEQAANAAYERLYNEASQLGSHGNEQQALTRLRVIREQWERERDAKEPGAARRFREQVEHLTVQQLATP